MNKILIALVLPVFLMGCANSRFSYSDVATAGGAVLGTGVGVAVNASPAGIVAGTIAGSVGGSALVKEEQQIDISKVPEEDRAKVLKNQQMWMVLEELGIWAIGAVLAFFLLPLLIGYLLPNGRERKLHNDVMNKRK